MPNDTPILGPSDMYGPCAPDSVTDYGQGSEPYGYGPPRFLSDEELDKKRDKLARFMSRYEIFSRPGEDAETAYQRHKARMDGTAMDRADQHYRKGAA